jgi:hypothetical protein
VQTSCVNLSAKNVTEARGGKAAGPKYALLPVDVRTTSEQQCDEPSGNSGYTDSDLLHGNSPLRKNLRRNRYARQGTAPLGKFHFRVK